MPALSNEILRAKLEAALPRGTKFLTQPDEVRPALVEIHELGTVRIYLWTLTEDRSRTGARPPGEFKIQLIVANQSSGEYGSLELADYPTVLLGFSPDLGVFVGWEARLYTNFAYSANVQVRDDLLLQARFEGWAVAEPRRSQGAEEVRVAFDSPHLPLFITASIQADRLGLEGERRVAFLLSRTPHVDLQDAPENEADLSNYIQDTRRRITTSRLNRDPRFASEVKRQYHHACALCTSQLGIVQAAHIIPVSVPEGLDEVWNGIALCPNHHKLFDCRLFAIDADLTVRVDQHLVAFLVESNLDSCIEQITKYNGEGVLPPSFWSSDKRLRSRMREALEWVMQRAGIAR